MKPKMPLLRMHDFVGPDKVNKYVHCKYCGLIFKPLQGRGPCPGKVPA